MHNSNYYTLLAISTLFLKNYNLSACKAEQLQNNYHDIYYLLMEYINNNTSGYQSQWKQVYNLKYAQF